MPSFHSSPFKDNSAFLSLLRHTSSTSSSTKRPKSSSSDCTIGLLKMFKLFPMLSSGCKMVAFLGRPQKLLLTDRVTMVTVFGYRKGRVSLARGSALPADIRVVDADGNVEQGNRVGHFEDCVGERDEESEEEADDRLMIAYCVGEVGVRGKEGGRRSPISIKKIIVFATSSKIVTSL